MYTEREGTGQALEKMLREWGDSHPNIDGLRNVAWFCGYLFNGDYAAAADYADKLPMSVVEAILVME